MVNLFKSCWLDIRNQKMGSQVQDLGQGCLHYKKDFIGRFDSLPNGWDTKIKHLKDG
jgi:hypothetical protein